MLQKEQKINPKEGQELFSRGPQEEAFAEDLFLVFTSLLGQYSKQGARGVENLWKGAQAIKG